VSFFKYHFKTLAVIRVSSGPKKTNNEKPVSLQGLQTKKQPAKADLKLKAQLKLLFIILKAG